MRNRYYEILRTYWRRPLSSWGEMLYAGTGLLTMFVAIVTARSATDFPVPLQAMMLMYLVMFLWGHFREQMTIPHKRLWSGYVVPHVIVFAVVLSLLVIVWPLGVTLLRPAWSLGFMSCTAIFVAMIGWWALTLSPLFLPVVLFGTYLWPMTPHGKDHINSMLRGEHEALAAGLLAAALAVIVVTIIRMVRLTEEDRLYHRQLKLNSWSVRNRVTGDLNQVWSEAQRFKWFRWQRTGRAPYLPTKSSLWDRARRWRGLSRGTA